MDPNANMREQRELAESIAAGFDDDDNPPDMDDARRLAELVLALDEWLSKGGFRPSRWQRAEADRG